MLNGLNNDAPGSGKARLVASAATNQPVTRRAEEGADARRTASRRSGPERMQWLAISCLVLLSVLAGGGAAWLLR